jgi:hypothetical protein
LSARTVTVTLSPASPLTVKSPPSDPSRLMKAEPLTLEPLTVAVPTGTTPGLHSQPDPLMLPLSDGASPDEGDRLIEGAASAGRPDAIPVAASTAAAQRTTRSSRVIRRGA